MKTIISFDVGTTSMKCCLFDEAFRILDSTVQEYALVTPDEHTVEVDPDVYYDGMVRCLRTLLEKGADPKDVAAIAITTQGETSILLDRDGKPLRPAVVWLDDRAGREAEILKQQIPAGLFYETTGLTEIGGALPLAKLMRFMSDPDLKRDTRKILLLEDYLVYRLTGAFKTERSLICSTGYYDINRHAVQTDFLRLAGADPEILPDVLPCGSAAGVVSREASRTCGIPAGVPVILTAMDQTASAVGAGNVSGGVVSETTGTCLTVAATVERPNYHSAATIQYYTHFNDQYLALSYNTTAAIIMKWFKDEFIRDTTGCLNSPLNAYDYMSELAAGVEPGADGVLLLPHFAGKAMPNFAPNVRGCFYGVSLSTRRASFIRAIMEGVAFLLRENLECMEKAGIPVREIRSLGGGARDALWLQIKASVTGKHFLPMDTEESTSLGAAILAGKALGLGNSVEELCAKAVTGSARIAPDPAIASIYQDVYRRYLALDGAMTALFD